MTTRRVVLDMDVGIDDALAILYLAGQRDVQIVALGSVHGNVDTAQATRNALHVLELAGLGDVPVARGAAVPLAQPLELATIVHGSDGLGDIGVPPPRGAPTGEHAADQLVRLAREEPGALDLLAVGPLTNLALAIQRDPAVLGRFRSVVIMGGSGPEPDDDRGMVIDANIDHDRAAADAVFAGGGNTVMVGVNVTMPTLLEAEQLEAIAIADTPQARFANRILGFYVDFYERYLGRRAASMHDPLAAGILRDPSLVLAAIDAPVGLVTTPVCTRAVVPRSPSPAVAHRRPTRVVTEVDGPRFVSDLVETLVRPWPARAEADR